MPRARRRSWTSTWPRPKSHGGSIIELAIIVAIALGLAVVHAHLAAL
jgi:hypothetical protein